MPLLDWLNKPDSLQAARRVPYHYIGVEMGDHAVRHCQPRLQKVVDGEQGGISKAVNWQGGGGFTFYRLGATVFDAYGMIDAAIRFPTLAAYIWYLETRTPWMQPKTLSPLLGIHDGTAYYLLYNDILGDRRPQGGNVLTQNVLDGLPVHNGKRVIYGETSRFGAGRLAAEGITFKQMPYDVRAG
jgi:adenine-specific DNA-methyltransferase